MKRAALARLAAIAEARRARDVARLEALLAERGRLDAEIAELAGTPARDAAEGSMPFAMMAQRTAWIEAQIAARERRIGAILIELAGVRAAARVSVGKHEVLSTLAGRAARAEAGAVEAREEAREEVRRAAARAPGDRRDGRPAVRPRR